MRSAWRTAVAVITGVFLITITSSNAQLSANEAMKGDFTSFYTPSEYAYDYFWLELYYRDYVVFSVRACSDVHIALAQTRSDMTFNVTEVVLGGWYNSKSVIRWGVGQADEWDKEHFLEVETPHLLHCTELRTFWISWGTRLRVGFGPIPGEQMFMDWERREFFVHAVQFVSFSTGYGHTGRWWMPENQGHYLIAKTPDDYRYEYLWKTTDYKNNHFRFRVVACNDVHVNLSPYFGSLHYEVVIGGWGNTKSVIRYGQAERVEYLATNITSCSELRMFWISWDNGLIEVGRGGELGQDKLMSVQDNEYPGVNYLAISTGYGSGGTWVLNDDLENVFKYFVHSEGASEPRYSVFAAVSRLHFIVFEVQACSDVWIALTPYAGFADDFSHRILIGGMNNTRTGVYSSAFPNAIAEASTPNILSCSNPNAFWVSWYNGVGEMGRFNLVGYNKVLTWNVSGIPSVNAVGFSSTHQSGGHFLARRNMGESLLTLTGTSLSYRQMWVSVRQDVIFKFRVRACHSVYLTLSGIIDTPEIQTYEVVIGACYLTIVRERVGSPDAIAAANTSDVLSCSQHREFWISWLDGYIRIGSGSRYRWNELVRMPDRKPHPITAISFSTSNGVFGEFEVESDAGDYLMIETPYGDTTLKWFHLHSYVRWFYFQVSGSGAHLILASRYQDPLDVYNIYIGAVRNTEITLWKGTTLLQRRIEPLLLNMFTMRSFWVSFNNGVIQMGLTKARGVEVLLNYTDTSYPFEITAFALAGERNAVAYWRIWENVAIEMSMWSQRYQFFDQAWWSVRHRTSIVFALQSCGHAEIVLSAVMHEYLMEEYVYVLVINDNRNMTGIWRGNQMKKLIEVPTPDILSCTREEFYWLDWYGGHIAFGRGGRRGRRTVVAYQEMDSTFISAIGFTTYTEVGSWRFPLSAEDFVRVPPRRDPNALSTGETAGVAIGAIILVVVFVGLFLMVLIPSTVSGLVDRARTAITSRSGSSVTASFDNPAAMNEFSEVHLS